MILFIFISFFSLALANKSELIVRDKRQSYYYICGTYPNQYYSLFPCYNNGNSNRCTNGGVMLNVGCYFDYQCTPYANGQTSQCINGCCCTAPTTPTTPTNLAYCATGQRSQVRCSLISDCAQGQTCLNGLCCTTTGQEFNLACAGLGALASCTNGACGNFICTTSNYCCECQFGRTSGSCTNGCPSGYSCSTSGFCCPSCPTGRTPYGSCYNGLCATGYTCSAGNICC